MMMNIYDDGQKLIHSGLQLRVPTKKLIFLFLNQNIYCGNSKEPSQCDGSFEDPKHVIKLMGKKIFTILRSKMFILSCADPEIFFLTIFFILLVFQSSKYIVFHRVLYGPPSRRDHWVQLLLKGCPYRMSKKTFSNL